MPEHDAPWTDVQVRLYRAGFIDAANAIDEAFTQGTDAIVRAFATGRRLLGETPRGETNG